MVFGIAAGVLLLAVLAAFLWPATYRSSATILIEQQEVPSDLVRSTISSYADQRIQVISQRVMTTQNLLNLVERYGLYAKEQRTKTREVIVERMRDDIDFQMISADVVDPRLGRPVKATIAFSVSYDSRSPDLAAKVANEITTLYLNENLESRRQLATDTTSFLTEEAARIRRRIVDLEGQIADFKEQHADGLPQRMELNLQLLNRAEDDLRNTETQITSLDQQIVYLDAQLAQISPSSQVYTSTGERVLSPADRLKFLRTEYARASAIYWTGHPDVVRLKREIEGLEQQAGAVDSSNDLARQLEDARTQLDSARKSYSSGHPDVVRLERLVAATEEALAEAAPVLQVAPQSPDNPAYIQVQAQREASVNERASLDRKHRALEARIQDMEQRLAMTPAVEKEYMVIARELESNQLKYREVSQKQMEAQLAQNLESERKGERFTLIEPPLAPQEPLSPNRKAILALGFVLALAAGVGAVLALDAVDARVRGRKDLEALLSLPPLAVLPWIETDEEMQRRSRRTRLALVSASMGVVLVMVLAHFLVRPLDVLWVMALRRLGG